MRKRSIIYCMVFIFVLQCVFTACNRRNQFAEMTDSFDSNTINSEFVTGTEDNPSNESLYDNIDLKLLYQDYMNSYVEPNMNMINTIYYVIISAENGGHAYSKQTGEIISICKDPICDHQSCIFDKKAMIVDYVISEERVYLLMDKLEKYVLYSFDLQMDDVKLIAEWDALDQPAALHYFDHKIYYSAWYLHDEPVQTTFVMDADSGEIELLWETDRFDSIAGGYNSQIFYKQNGSLYSYDLSTKQDQVVIPSSVLDVDRGEIALSFRWANETTISSSVYSTIYGSQNYELNRGTGEKYLCNMQNGPDIAHSKRLGDYFYFFVRHDTDEYQQDKHYSYYIQQPEEVYGMANPSGGELWCCSVSGGEKKLVASMETDGIPDNIWDISTYDGKYIIVRYSTYKDYQNEYTPGDGLGNHEYSRFAFIDPDSGSVYKFQTKLR